MKKLVIDVETSPNIVLEFDIRSSTPRSPDHIIEPSRILCFAYKWIGEKGVKTVAEWDEDHEAMIRKAHDLLSEADAVIHFNGKRFDIRRLNAEFIELGLAPPAPFEQIDLLQQVKAKAEWPSHRLAYLSRVLSIASKGNAGGMDTWRGVMAGDPKAQTKMLRYNARDVVVTEQMYRELFAWVGGPNEAVGAGLVCSKCKGKLVANGVRRARSRLYQRYQCKGCGSWSQSVKSIPESTAEVVPV